jgi:hypothetical protein
MIEGTRRGGQEGRSVAQEEVHGTMPHLSDREHWWSVTYHPVADCRAFQLIRINPTI